MSEVAVIVCDKCGGRDVHHYVRKSAPTVVEKTMSEVADTANKCFGVPGIHVYTQYILHCPDCGHMVKYQA